MLPISFDSILNNSLGLRVSCRKFHWVTILWMLGLGVLGCRVGVVLQPSGQRCPHPFLASFHQILNNRASILNLVGGLNPSEKY